MPPNGPERHNGPMNSSPEFFGASHDALTAAAQDAQLPDAVLSHWFGSARPSNAVALEHKAQWFTKSPAFDEDLRQRFGVAVQAAVGGALQHWAQQGPWQRLALIVLLDQFTRNIYRATPQSFAGDAQALALALQAQQQGEDLLLPEVPRIFMYLPFEHAEDPAMQERSVQAFAALADANADPALSDFFAGTLDYAHKHQEVIAQFGRFPHRNPTLGRESTAAEKDYLAQPGAGF